MKKQVAELKFQWELSQNFLHFACFMDADQKSTWFLHFFSEVYSKVYTWEMQMQIDLCPKKC